MSLPIYSYNNGRHIILDLHRSKSPNHAINAGSGELANDSADNIVVSPVRTMSPLVVDSTNASREAFVIGITGGSASGKTSVAEKLLSMLPNQRVAIVTQDSFYRNLTPEELPNARDFNWDCPEAFDWKLQKEVLTNLRARRKVMVPIYDYVHNCRSTDCTVLWNVDVVIFEGILAFYHHPNPELCLDNLIDLKIFVETDGDTRLARRLFRDTQFRGRSIASVLAQYSKFVKPSYETHIAPLKRRADIIIPWGDYGDNVFSDDGSWKSRRYPALDMIVEHIKTKIGFPLLSSGLYTAET